MSDKDLVAYCFHCQKNCPYTTELIGKQIYRRCRNCGKMTPRDKA